jgi:hypothetical protein
VQEFAQNQAGVYPFVLPQAFIMVLKFYLGQRISTAPYRHLRGFRGMQHFSKASRNWS